MKLELLLSRKKRVQVARLNSTLIHDCIRGNSRIAGKDGILCLSNSKRY